LVKVLELLSALLDEELVASTLPCELDLPKPLLLLSDHDLVFSDRR